jgi:hypothetical protein
MILKGKIKLQLVHYALNGSLMISNKDNVINIDQKKDMNLGSVIGEERGIQLRTRETNVQ